MPQRKRKFQRQSSTAAEAEVKAKNARVVIAVVDEGGNLLVLQRLDDPQVARVDVGIGKARTAAIFRRPSREFEEQVKNGRVAALALPGATPWQGGVPISFERKVIGAIGVSGETPAQDEEIASTGANAMKELAAGTVETTPSNGESHAGVGNPVPWRKSTGRLCFNWYRIKITIPEKVGNFDPTGSTVVFELVIDDYAEIWVNSKLPVVLGQTGGQLVKGFNAPNRVVIGREVKPGQQFQLAVFGVNGPVSNPPGNFIWIRSATLDFYGGNWDPERKIVMRYDVRVDGTLTNGKVFFDMTSAPGEDALDGIKVDRQGNLYVSGPGGLWIISSDGKHLGTLKGPEHPHNLAWGDDDGKALYLAAQTSVYRIRLNVPGIRPGATMKQ
jgi:uncharacterized protein GlcG (DUF336 family)